MINRSKDDVKRFVRQYNLHAVTVEALADTLVSRGFEIIEFNNIYNDDDVACLIESLDINWYVQHSKGFTYADNNQRLVFIHESLSEEEKLLVLAHEVGHIFCEHLNSLPVIGKDVRDEYEASEFAHYLLHQNGFLYILKKKLKYKKPIVIIAAIIAMVIIGGVIISSYHKEQSYYGEYYVTATGSKYHEKNCIFIKGKTNVHRLSKIEFETGRYDPCKICLP